jgi:hypothetical protein
LAGKLTRWQQFGAGIVEATVIDEWAATGAHGQGNFVMRPPGNRN